MLIVIEWKTRKLTKIRLRKVTIRNIEYPTRMYKEQMDKKKKRGQSVGGEGR